MAKAIVCTFVFFITPLLFSFNGYFPNWKSISQTYIYGYKNSTVIAEINNATSNKVAYAGFESADNNGYWTYSTAAGATGGSLTDVGRTGIKYYNIGSGSIKRATLPAGKYFVSYWSTGTVNLSGTNYSIIRQKNIPSINGWAYYEYFINITANNSSITLSGSSPVKIDEVRLYPENAQMLTYTYDILIGKTSETDNNNMTIYYEYDEFNRLRYIKDHRGNIIKRYTYNIKH